MEQLAQVMGILMTIGIVVGLCSFTFNRRWARRYTGLDDAKFKKDKWKRRWITISAFIVGAIGFIGTVVAYFIQ